MDTPVLFRSKRIRVVVCIRLTKNRGWEAQKRQQDPSRWILHSTPPSIEREIGEHARSRYYARVKTGSNAMRNQTPGATGDVALWFVDHKGHTFWQRF